MAHRFTFLALVFAALALMTASRGDVTFADRARVAIVDSVVPVLDVLSRPAASVARLVDHVHELTELRVENERLRAQVEQLRRWHAVAGRLEAENNTLRGLLNVVPDPEARYITARVVADNGGPFVHGLLINAGRREGVRKGQAVLTSEGLVGRVAQVGERSSRVLLLSDLNARVPVVLEVSRARAILAGDNSDQPKLQFLMAGTQVSPGDRIVTSGHGGAFPPGLSVGVVSAVTDAGVRVQPYVERNRLEYVRVVDFGLDGIIAPLEDAPSPRTAERGGKS